MIPPPKFPAFYLRVSTTAQDFPAQLNGVQEYARRQGWAQPNKKTLFCEKISGARASRRELDRLVQACRAGTFDAIITYRADRLGRTAQHMVNLYAELKRIKIRVIGTQDNVDTADGSPGGEFFRNMLASYAQFNRETIVENVKAGLAAARRQGRIGGRPRKNDKQIARAFKLKEEGKNPTQIAAATGLARSYIYALFSGKRRAPKLLP